MRRQLIILSALIAGAVSVMAQPRCNADGTVTFQYKTGKEQQFTPGVMARLFPKPIISPEYTEQGIIFRFKAPVVSDSFRMVLPISVVYHGALPR